MCLCVASDNVKGGRNIACVARDGIGDVYVKTSHHFDSRGWTGRTSSIKSERLIRNPKL